MSAVFDNKQAVMALWQMQFLERGWDSYDACTIDERAIKKALELLKVLPGYWDAVPVNDGTVQLEQHRDGFDIEVSVAVNGSG